MAVYKIALIGSPCSGKTAIFNELQKNYEATQPNMRIIYISEVATYFLLDIPKKEDIMFQYYVAKTQVLLENLLSFNEGDGDVILICDRGVFDIYAYIESLDAYKIISKIEKFQDYSLVLYLESLPRDIFELNKGNNVCRKEMEYLEIVRMGNKTLQSWSENSLAEIQSITVKDTLQDRADECMTQINLFFKKEILKRKGVQK